MSFQVGKRFFPNLSFSLQLPKFFYLCEDGVWGVRKACADVFMPVSCVCSSAVRQQELSPLFINLLRDQSRWVRMAAFQALGPFISTFADPSITALLHNDNGEIVITEPDTLAERLDILEKERAREREEKETRRKEEQTVIKEVVPEEGDVSQAENMELVQEDDEESKDSKTSQDDDDLSVEEKRAKAYQESRKEEEDFNSFHFWREPLPEVDDLASISKSDEEQLAEGLEKIQVTDEAKEDSGEHSQRLISSSTTLAHERKAQSTHTVPPILHPGPFRDDQDDEAVEWRKLPSITFQTFDDLTGRERDTHSEAL